MSDVFGGNVAVAAGFEGLRQAFLVPQMTVQKASAERLDESGEFPLEVHVVETSDAGFGQDKEFVFHLYEDGQVLIMVDLGEDLSEVILAVKEHVRWASGVQGFPYPQDWVLDDEEEEADMERILAESEAGEGFWYSPADRGYFHS